MLNFRLARPSALVDLSELGLDGIRLEDGALVVGAMTRQWDLEHHADAYPLLRDALRYVGHTATRCRGTVGRLARPRRPDRRAARVRACARSGAAHDPSHDPGGGVLRLGLHDRARAGRAAHRDPVPRARRRDVVPRGRAPRRRLRRGLRGPQRRPCRRRRRCGDAGALGGGDVDPIGDLFAPAGYKRAIAERLVAK